jgi:hypothetical protein
MMKYLKFASHVLLGLKNYLFESVLIKTLTCSYTTFIISSPGARSSHGDLRQRHDHRVQVQAEDEAATLVIHPILIFQVNLLSLQAGILTEKIGLHFL